MNKKDIVKINVYLTVCVEKYFKQYRVPSDLENQGESGNWKMVWENVKYLIKVREIYKYLIKVRENVKKIENDFKG